MNYSNIDTIVRKGLLESGYPIHWYAEFLYHGAACLRELNFDTLKIVNSAHFKVNSYGAIPMPDDFSDDVGVCIPSGGNLGHLPRLNTMNPIRIHDTEGQFEPYTNKVNGEKVESVFGFPVGWGWFWNISDFAEPTGRFFGANGGTNQGYQVFKERREIQLTHNFIGKNVILLYISDGTSISAASQIDSQAIQTIRAFTEWKRNRQAANNEYSPEAKHFQNQRRLLRARLSPLDKATILNTIRNAQKASIKG